MNTKTNRLFFIDAMRAWAILMMLQGHFIDGLLDPVFRDENNLAFTTWKYFRGITAPVFFTVSGFIFTYLLIRVPEIGMANPRVKKGIRRGLQLLLIGYLLRMNLFGLLSGNIYDSFYLVDVLHCIGLSILSVIGLYLFSANKSKILFPTLLLGVTLLLFTFEPIYKQWSFSFLPNAVANYFTKANGSVFTIIPWLGYATIGGFLSVLFTRYKNFKHLYLSAITISGALGLLLIFYSSKGLIWLHETTSIGLFALIEQNNYLFIRLGDVFVVFAIFMILRRFMSNATILKIGASTLTIYVIHFIILYGSFTGMGLYRFFNHSLSPAIVIPGALAFMFICTFLSLRYKTHEAQIKANIGYLVQVIKMQSLELYKVATPVLKEVAIKIRVFLIRVFGIAKN
ncbi:acyltransferase family protein [Flagellimonas meridianipacifica]|uniref:Putative membrane protein n=1 Tax=Flagellimonas meridianipacifica TaxID=1080225 RepID=A0A2T0MB13_9FLAO|nr:acyltransferase family protein [Allomuricauda pacifica]PRX54691.1 putative membrane protein [Allomuricauda pacifica]